MGSQNPGQRAALPFSVAPRWLWMHDHARSVSLDQLCYHRIASAELQVQQTWLFDLAKCHTVKTPAGTSIKMRQSQPGVIAAFLKDSSRRRGAGGELQQSRSLLLQRKLQVPDCGCFYTKKQLPCPAGENSNNPRPGVSTSVLAWVSASVLIVHAAVSHLSAVQEPLAGYIAA